MQWTMDGVSPPDSRVDAMADPSSYRPEPGQIPDSPGVYRFRDEHRRVIYVGKAKSLRQRLSSYFQDLANLHPRTRDDGHHSGLRRVDRGLHRGRGAAAGVLLDQGVRPAVQRQVPRRQELSVSRRDAERGVPARPGDARRQAQGRALLRSVRPRLGDPRDRRPDAPCLPRTHLLRRGLQEPRAERAVPACSATSASARRPASAGSPPRSTANWPRSSATSWPAAPARTSAVWRSR